MNRKSSFSRRDFLQSGLIGGAGAALLGPTLLSGVALATDTSESFCVALCNHWSYIGIGWQSGIESCVLSVTDAMELYDRAHVKTCINLDARAYEFMAEKFPEVAARLKKYLAAGNVELIAGTYGQPMGTTIGNESNIRQMVIGRATVRKALDYDLATFLEEEEFSHPQVPQLAKLAGYTYTSLAQLDTWGRAGCPVQDLNSLQWQGMDGTAMPCVPKNALFGAPADAKQLVASPAFKKLAALGKPLLFTWEEFGWDDPEHPAYLTVPARYKALAAQGNVEFVTIRNTSRSTAPRARKRSACRWTRGTSRSPGDSAAIRCGSSIARWSRCCWPPKSSTRPPRRWAPPRSATCWTRLGETSWPRRATTWDSASRRVGKAT